MEARELWARSSITRFERIRSISGLQAAAIGTNLPFLGSGLSSILIQGRPLTKNPDSQFVQFNAVSPGYFQTLRIPLLRGRDLSFRDTANSAPVVIVNEALANRFFSEQNPIGHRLAYYSDHPHWKMIVGMVADVRQHGVESGPVPEDVHSTCPGRIQMARNRGSNQWRSAQFHQGH